MSLESKGTGACHERAREMDWCRRIPCAGLVRDEAAVGGGNFFEAVGGVGRDQGRCMMPLRGKAGGEGR